MDFHSWETWKLMFGDELRVQAHGGMDKTLILLMQEWRWDRFSETWWVGSSKFLSESFFKKSLKERKLPIQFEEEVCGGHSDGDSSLWDASLSKELEKKKGIWMAVMEGLSCFKGQSCFVVASESLPRWDELRLAYINY